MKIEDNKRMDEIKKGQSLRSHLLSIKNKERKMKESRIDSSKIGSNGLRNIHMSG